MEYAKVKDADRSRVVGLLPDYKQNIMRLIATHIFEPELFVASDNGSVVAQIVCVMYKSNPKGIFVFDIKVAPSYEDTDVYANLYYFVEDYYRNRGVTFLWCFTYVEEEGGKWDAPLKQLAFKRQEHSTRFLYEAGELRKSKFGMSLEKLTPLLKQVRGIHELTINEKYEIEKFYEKYRPGMTSKSFSSEYARFFFSEGKVLGYIAFDYSGDDIYTMFDMEIVKGSASEYALPAMLASIVDISGRKLDDKAALVLFADGEVNTAAMKNALGEASDYSESYYWEKVL